MRLTLILTMINIMSATAIGFSQNTKLTLNLRNASLKDAFNEIERQSSFSILYKADAINQDKKVNIHASRATIDEVLNKLFVDKKIHYKILDNSLIVLLPGNSNEQQPVVKGKITDSSTGEPLPGVTIVIDGTAKGVTSDMDGNYSIQVPNTNSVLVFSYVGYKAEKIQISGRPVIDVKMSAGVEKLDEIVVVGYGTVKKKDLTGAVSSVQGDALAERKTTQISQALQGAVPGLMVTRSSNAPGSTATLRIRGITTIGESSPLIIMDGIPVDDINGINPNDVENISVLKDAASASIYGSRAAAGVILVTTKRAKEGQLAMDYNYEYGVEKPTSLPSYVGVTRYMQMVNELRWNDNANNSNEYPTYSKDVIDNYATLNANNPDLYPNTDWKKLILNDYAPRQTHILNITAGTKVIRTKVSLAYDNSNALYDGRTYERYTARFNNDVTINQHLSATIDFNFKQTISKQPTVDPIYKMNIVPPLYAAIWSDGLVASGKDGANIYGQLKYGGFNNAWYNTLGGKVSIDYTPLDGLKFTGVISPTLDFNKFKFFQKSIPYTSYNNPNTVSGYLEGAAQTYLNENRNDSHDITYQFLANYAKSFGKHNLNAMAGYEYYYNFVENLGASRGQYALTNYPYLDDGPLILRDNSGNAYENAYRSYFGRIMYNYNNKYYLQGNVRYDGSSRFDKNYRWGAFPSVSAGYVLSEESFMKNIKFLSFLKLRGSYGTLGNDRIGNYPYQAALNFESNSLFYQGNTAVSAQAAAQWQYAIKDITWETTQSWDGGLDANFFNNRLRFTGDYYKKTTRDMLLALEIPDYIGFDNPNQNTGKMHTTGWEFELSWNHQLGKFDYAISVNLSDFKSVMGDLGGTEFIGDQIKIQGSEFNEWYGYKSLGLFQTQDEVNNSPKLNSNVKPGDVKYADISGPNGVPDGIISPEYDRVLLGGSMPRYMYGGNIQLGYGNFDFSVVWQGVGKQNSQMTTSMVEPLLENYGNFPKILDGNSWSKYNTDDQNLHVKYPRYSYTSVSNNYAMSDYWLFKGAYLRIKNVTLGYTIPKNLIQKIKLQNVKIYTTVSDFFTYSHYPKGWDPEMSSLSYPITTSFILGVSVKF